MCKPISFISDGKGSFKFIDFNNRQLATNGGLIDKKGKPINSNQCDSHAAIAAFFGKNEDNCNKYEFNYSTQSVDIDQLNTSDDSKKAKEWATKTLNGLVCRLIKDGNDDSVLNLLPYLMTKENAVAYAAFAASQVLSIFEKLYPKDDRPRKAIEAAMTPGVSAYAADAAARAADAAAYAAARAAARAAAYAAAYAAADAAADAAANAADAAAYAAANAADAAANAAAYAADAAANATGKKKLTKKLVSFGRKLVKLYG